MRQILGLLTLLFCLGLAGQTLAQEDSFPAEMLYTIEIDHDQLLMDIQWSPTGDYFALYLSQGAQRGAWFAYDTATGASLYDAPMIAWYADDSHFLFEDEEGLGVFNTQTRQVDFRLPHESLDFAGAHYSFLAWMTWFGDEPQAVIGDEIMIFDVSSFSDALTDEPNFFVYDSQTGEEIFSLATVFQPPVYLPEREQVVISRQSPTRLEIYDRATWQLTDTQEGFVVPYGMRWWNEDGSHLLVAASDAPIELAPDEGWDYFIWTPDTDSLVKLQITGSHHIHWLANHSQLVGLNDAYDFIFYDVVTGEIERVLANEGELVRSIMGISDTYILMAYEQDRRLSYDVWDIEAETMIPLGSLDWGGFELAGDVVWRYGLPNRLPTLNLRTGEWRVLEYDSRYLEFSDDGQWMAAISSLTDTGDSRTLTIYNLETGAQFSHEVESGVTRLYWRDNSEAFALFDYENRMLSMWVMR